MFSLSTIGLTNSQSLRHYTFRDRKGSGNIRWKLQNIQKMDRTLWAITDAVEAGNKMTLVGFGTFTVSERAARKGRNPWSGKAIAIPTKKVVTHLVQAGVDLPTVQRISGHKSFVMVIRYSHQNGKHIESAIDGLEERDKIAQ